MLTSILEVTNLLYCYQWVNTTAKQLTFSEGDQQGQLLYLIYKKLTLGYEIKYHIKDWSQI